MGKFIDLTGQRFGFLTVNRRGPSGKRKETRWWCRCSCGNEVLVTSVNLRKGNTRSCGCKTVDLFRDSRKRLNRYEFHANYVVGFTSSGIEFYIDPEDYEIVKNHSWVQFRKGAQTYITARQANGKNLFLHRMLTDAKGGEVVDHLNHNGCDNRRCNLRVVTQKKNMRNLQLRVDNKSGVTGVSWDANRKKWAANLSCGGVNYRLGRFDSFDEAVAARKAAEEKYFGEYSYDNSMAAVSRIAV